MRRRDRRGWHDRTRDGTALGRTRRRAGRDRGARRPRRRGGPARRQARGPRARASPRRRDPHRVPARAADIRGTWDVERQGEPALPALGRRDARVGSRAVAPAHARPRGARVLLGVQRVAAGGPHPGPRRDVPRRPVLHLLRCPFRRHRGSVPARARPGARAAARRGVARVRHDRRVHGARGARHDRHGRELHVPAPQAGPRLAARRHGPVAAVHPRRRSAGLAMFVALERLARLGR
ncbi:MAG: hypothetical protein QOD73_2654 [Solirubrobacteraceae bacterium]|nr:hypothetical protein [Solirubrobacteraceae bacterium]